MDTISLVEAGKRLGIERVTAYRLAQQGTFPVRVIRVGLKLRVPTRDFEKLVGISKEEVCGS
jgi:predicted site-specific integrase-resolvase